MTNIQYVYFKVIVKYHTFKINYLKVIFSCLQIEKDLKMKINYSLCVGYSFHDLLDISTNSFRFG